MRKKASRLACREMKADVGYGHLFIEHTHDHKGRLLKKPRTEMLSAFTVAEADLAHQRVILTYRSGNESILMEFRPTRIELEFPDE